MTEEADPTLVDAPSNRGTADGATLHAERLPAGERLDGSVIASKGLPAAPAFGAGFAGSVDTPAMERPSKHYDDKAGWPDTICVPLASGVSCEWHEVPVTPELIEAIRRAMTPSREQTPASRPRNRHERRMT